MRYLLTPLGLLIIAGIWVASMFFNAQFGYTLGQSDLDHKLFAAVAILSDGLKTVLPFLIAAALVHKKLLQVASMAIVFVICIALSLVSAIEYGAQSRSAKANKVSTKFIEVKGWQDSLARKRAKLSQTPDPVTAQEYRLKIKALHNSTEYKRRWKSTKGCTVATTSKSKKLCNKVTNLDLKFLQAQKNERLEAQIKTLQGKIAQAGLGKVSDHHAPKMAMAKITGISSQVITTALVIALAFLLEIASSLGFWWVLDYKPSRQTKAKAKKRSWPNPKTLLKRPTYGCVNSFMDNSVGFSQNSKTSSGSAYGVYKRWCKATGQDAVAEKKFRTLFAKRLQNAGWKQQGQKNGDIIWLDLDMKMVA